MNIILLSGGSGKRLWPLSNDVRSKQFIRIFKKEDGSYESMLQRMYRMIMKVDAGADVTIATAKSQISAIHNQIGEDISISIEPCRKDTFPAIALACLYLRDVKHVDEQQPVVICPVDPYVEEDYFLALKQLFYLAQEEKANISVMGIEPTYPSEKYGYVLPETSNSVSNVKAFKEKPDALTAEKYIQEGALWNAGVFAFRISYIAEKAEELLHAKNYQELFDKYDALEKISFDYAVAEHEKKIQVMRFHGAWKDLGTWNTLSEAMSEPVIGNAVLNDKCHNVNVINALDVPVLAMGIENAVIAASPEGILVSDKEESSYIKPYVDQFDQQIMFAEKSWGSFLVLDVEETSLTIRITLLPGHQMNYHSHKQRDEVWTVISGHGKAIVNEAVKEIRSGDVIHLPAGCRHTVMAETELKIIEVQIGKDIDVHDKEKWPLDKKLLSKGEAH